MTTETEVLDLVDPLAKAEQGNDPEALEGLLADDFVGVGPLGFVLTASSGWPASATAWEPAFAVEDAQRDYGTAAVVVGVGPRRPASRAATTPAGSASPWSRRRPDGRWLLANAHIGTLQQPGGPPPS